PEQRKMVEEMMAKRGVAMQPGGNNAVRICFSREMVERNEMPMRNEGNCKSERSPRAGNTMKVKFTWANPPSTGSGEITFNGSDAYSSNMTITRTNKQGAPETMTVQSSGKWLGADCGTLKPPAVH